MSHSSEVFNSNGDFAFVWLLNPVLQPSSTPENNEVELTEVDV